LKENGLPNTQPRLGRGINAELGLASAAGIETEDFLLNGERGGHRRTHRGKKKWSVRGRREGRKYPTGGYGGLTRREKRPGAEGIQRVLKEWRVRSPSAIIGLGP